MPLDAICLRAVTNELNNVLAGCRVEKVYQPDRDEIVLQTRGGQGGPRRLLLSIAAGAPRVHLLTRLERIRRHRRCSACCCASMCRRKDCGSEPAGG